MIRNTRIEKRFTLIELLVVVAIIAILLAILLPVLARARSMANEAICASRQRQVGLALILFADEHDHFLPGNRYDRGNIGENAWMADWLFGNDDDFNDTPVKGTLWPYVEDRQLYRCPSLPFIRYRSGEGSNGHFDYVAYEGFTGAKVGKLPTETLYASFKTVRTPLITEEDPRWHINTSSTNVEGAHGNLDKMGHWHRGGGNYVAVDGSVSWFKEDWARDANSWTARGPSGRDGIPIGHTNTSFGWWNEQ